MIPARVLLAAVACAASLRAEAQVRDGHPLEEIVVTSERRAFQSRAEPASLVRSRPTVSQRSARASLRALRTRPRRVGGYIEGEDAYEDTPDSD